MDRFFAKTKILCTLGPATDSKDKLKQILNAGVDGFRLNFSHGSHEYFTGLLSKIDSISNEMQVPVSLLQDLSGPKIRVGKLSQKEIELKAGNKIEIVNEDILGTAEKITSTYHQLHSDASIGDKILIDDGLIKLVVTGKNESSLIAEILNGGILKPRKGMNFPGMTLRTPALTEKDYQDLEFGLNYPINFVALSFVRSADDIRLLRDWLTEKKVSRSIIAKIEKPEAIENFTEILSVVDGIMIARGDLGVEMEPQEVPVIQKKIIKQCNEAGKIVITATQMLESMVINSFPTRAEASDIANAVIDGTDVVMLSAETSVGKFPLESIKMMNDILLKTESEFGQGSSVSYQVPEIELDNLYDAAGKSIVTLSKQIKAKAIVVYTDFGKKAMVLSKYRPDAKIIAVSPNIETVNMLCLYRGIEPYFIDNCVDEESFIEKSKDILKKAISVNKGDFVIFTSGTSIEKGRRNWVQIITY